MITYAIIENEKYALDNLRMIIQEISPDFEIVFSSDSVSDAVEFFRSHHTCDLVFMDIELSDGNCFKIFEQVDVIIPVIFITAYDQFALQAFRVNSIDYILKPYEKSDVKQSLEKFKRTRPAIDLSAISQLFQAKKSRDRLLICKNDKYFNIPIDNLAYLYSEDKYVFAYLKDGSREITNYTSLKYLEDSIDASRFFRISRNIIINIDAIKSVSKFFTGRLKVHIAFGSTDIKVVVSAAKKREFLTWYGGE